MHGRPTICDTHTQDQRMGRVVDIKVLVRAGPLWETLFYLKEFLKEHSSGSLKNLKVFRRIPEVHQNGNWGFFDEPCNFYSVNTSFMSFACVVQNISPLLDDSASPSVPAERFFGKEWSGRDVMQMIPQHRVSSLKHMVFYECWSSQPDGLLKVPWIRSLNFKLTRTGKVQCNNQSCCEFMMSYSGLDYF